MLDASFRIKTKALRLNTGMKRDEAAKKLGISPTILGRVERGEKQLSLELARKMSELYHIPIDMIE